MYFFGFSLLLILCHLMLGVTLLFTEPPEARKPDIRWRLYVFKAGEVLNGNFLWPCCHLLLILVIFFLILF